MGGGEKEGKEMKTRKIDPPRIRDNKYKKGGAIMSFDRSLPRMSAMSTMSNGSPLHKVVVCIATRHMLADRCILRR